MRVAMLVVALAVAVSGCTGDGEKDKGNGGDPKKGGIVLRGFPAVGEWEIVGAGQSYGSKADDLDPYVGEERGVMLRANSLDTMIVNQYRLKGWDSKPKEEGKPKELDLRRIRVEIYLHQMSVGAAKTFQTWHYGQSIGDLGEKAVIVNDAVIFLRGSVVVRLVIDGPWEAKTATKPAMDIGKRLDAWLQGK